MLPAEKSVLKSAGMAGPLRIHFLDDSLVNVGAAPDSLVNAGVVGGA
jgi:hypothetical protein